MSSQVPHLRSNIYLSNDFERELNGSQSSYDGLQTESSMVMRNSSSFMLDEESEQSSSAEGEDGLSFGGGLSEAHLENQKLVVNVFHKVLTSLRQYALEICFCGNHFLYLM